MLFWSTCLLFLYQTSTLLLEPLLPLYLYFNGFELVECALVFMVTSFLTMVVTGWWTKWMDQQEERYSTLILVVFSLMGLLSFIMLLNQPSWIRVVGYCVLNGVFYQPLQVLMDGMAIKRLGDFKVLFYGSYISQSKMIGILIMALQSAYYYYFNINNPPLFAMWLLGPSIISTSLLLLISLFHSKLETTSNSNPFNISQDQAAILKNNHPPRHSMTADQLAFYYYHHYHYPTTYKPYSLFAHPLSHISEQAEEEEELLLDDEQRESLMVYTMDEHLFHATTTRSSYFSFRTTSTPVACHALCLFVFNQQHKDGLSGVWVSQEEIDELPIFKRSHQEDDDQQIWKKRSLMLTVLCMGMGRGWIVLFLPLYQFYVLELNLATITCLLVAYQMGEWITSRMVEKHFQRLNLVLMTTCVHLTFILYVLIYPYIKVKLLLLFILQCVLGGSFQWMWLSSSKAVNDTVESYYERMKLRSIMSCLYTCVGPSIGALVMACSMESMDEFAFLMSQALFLFVVSFLLSWGWSF